MDPTKLQKAIYLLLNNEPFFGHFILNSKIMYDAYNVPTAAVTIMNGSPLLIFNRKFLDELNQHQVAQVVKHEILHLVFNHPFSTKDESLDRFIANIAQDCAINQYLSGLPEYCITLESISQMTGKNLEPFQTSDYYYKHLMDKKEELEKSGKGTLDEHNPDLPCDSESLAKGAVEKAVKEAAGKSAGNTPDFVVKQMSGYAAPKVNWKQLLRNFVLTRVTCEKIYTHKKMDRRYPLPIPGKKKKRSMVLGVCLDSSGSVSDEQFSSFLNEVKSIAKQVSKAYLIHADCAVQSVEEVGPNTKIDRTRKGNGGTAYNPAIQKCVELKCDVIVYFGDCDSADLPINPRVPFLWVVVGDQSPQGGFGKTIRI